MLKQHKNKGNLLFLALVALFALFYINQVSQMRHIETKITPYVFSAGLLFVIFIEFFRSRRLLRSIWKDIEFAKINKNIFLNLVRNKKVVLYFTLILYVFIIPRVGFFVSSFFFMCATMYLLNVRKILPIVLLPSIFLSIIYGVFKVLLNVRFPIGIFI